MRDLAGPSDLPLSDLPLADLRALHRLLAAASAALLAIDADPETNPARASIERDDGCWLLTIELPEAEA